MVGITIKLSIPIGIQQPLSYKKLKYIYFQERGRLGIVDGWDINEITNWDPTTAIV